MNRLPHPIPYQGSKRSQAAVITGYLRALPARPRRMFEPFAGSAAITLAAAHQGLAEGYYIGDALAPLVQIWQQIVERPAALADRYEALWAAATGRERAYYDEVRGAYNTDHEPAKLLYLLVRCVKNAVRFNQEGLFNQSPDRRRLGTHPQTMRASLLGAHALLAGKTTCAAQDYEALIEAATPEDVVYLDPPYQGTSSGKDQRYVQSLDRARLVSVLDALRRRGVPFLVSFDGRCGPKSYGAPLPDALGLTRVEVDVGRSTQATLNGADDRTVESLYLSPPFTR